MLFFVVAFFCCCCSFYSMGLVHLTALCHRAPKKKEKEDVKKLKSTTRVFFFFSAPVHLCCFCFTLNAVKDSEA